MAPKGKQAAFATAQTQQARASDTQDSSDDIHVRELSAPLDQQDPLGAQLAATQERIQQLEELAALQNRVRELEASIRDPSKTPRQRSSSSSSSDRNSEIKIRNIATLAISSTFRKRDDWLNDLRRAFNEAPLKFRKDSRKILLALDYMDPDGRARWDRFLAEQTDERQQALNNDWDSFVEWSLTLIKEAANLQPYLMRQLEAAKQREHQSPAEFHAYLDSFEQHLLRADEKALAYTFYAKLRDDLRNHIDLTASLIPETRQEMVDLATRYWNVLNRSNKRKHEDSGKGNNPHDREKKAPRTGSRNPSGRNPQRKPTRTLRGPERIGWGMTENP